MTLEQKRYYYNNFINGKNSFYYDNGQIAQEATYNYGTLDGLYKQWYKTGKPKIIANYIDGHLIDNKFKNDYNIYYMIGREFAIKRTYKNKNSRYNNSEKINNLNWI